MLSKVVPSGMLSPSNLSRTNVYFVSSFIEILTSLKNFPSKSGSIAGAVSSSNIALTVFKESIADSPKDSIFSTVILLFFLNSIAASISFLSSEVLTICASSFNKLAQSIV